MARSIAYILYYLIAKRMPRSYELGFVGKISKKFRSRLCSALFAQAPMTIGVEKGADFGSGRNIFLDDHSQLGEDLRIMGSGKVSIGKHVMMGPEVLIITEDHKAKDRGFDGYVRGEIVIGDNAWIGARAILLKKAVIGKNAIIGAGSVVTGPIPDDAVACGNPAKVVKMRDKDEY